MRKAGWTFFRIDFNSTGTSAECWYFVNLERALCRCLVTVVNEIPVWRKYQAEIMTVSRRYDFEVARTGSLPQPQTLLATFIFYVGDIFPIMRNRRKKSTSICS